MELRCYLLLFTLGLAAAKLTGEIEIDVDDSYDWDIPTINDDLGLNLLQGDIQQGDAATRNTINGENYRWPTTVPYYLEDSLDINAKGVILKVFDQYRLKTCLDFTPWTGQQNYISVYKGSGCSSSVGNQQVGKQRLSIGKNCDRFGIVEHEFLHALGFDHEQSRADRDDYVNIMWDRIQPGKEHNFETSDDRVFSALGVPYDYDSVMHYGQMTFSISSEPTIITKIPHFMDLIGQRIGFSAGDLSKINQLYNCTKSSKFLESCHFEEESVCGMIQGAGNKKWEWHASVDGGPQTDFTHMGQCKEKGYFMHFSTASVEPGDQASLETQWLYPKPGTHCLQFFLHQSGASDDVLNIWVRDHNNDDLGGKLTLFRSITGGVLGSWELHTVTLNMTQKARVVFEGIRGNGASSGGFSLDDINLTSMECPQHIWHIRNLTDLMATTPTGTKIYSPRFLSPTGYSFQIGTYPTGKSSRPGYMGTYFHLTSGPNDHNLQWPCPWHQATIALMDQQSDIRQQMNMHRMITTDPGKMSSDGTEFYWDDPKKVGSKVTVSDGSFYYRGPGYGTSTFIAHNVLRTRNFIKGDDAFFLFSLEDISALLGSQPLSRAAVHANEGVMKAAAEGPPQDTATHAVVATAVTGCAVAVAVVLLLIIRRRRRRQRESDRAVIIQDIPGFIEEYPVKELRSAASS